MNPNRRPSNLRSGLLGAAAAVVLLVTLGAYRPIGSPTTRVLLIQSDPPASSIVQVLEGQAYTVPAGKRLSVKALGQAGGLGVGGTSIDLQFNGADVLLAQTNPNPVQLEMPLVAASGDIVTVKDEFDDPLTIAVAQGYLTDF
jgi:hypothetical protein